MTQPYKICPQCQHPAAMNASACVSCGRVYRTTAPPICPAYRPPAPGSRTSARVAACIIAVPVGFIAMVMIFAILNPVRVRSPGPVTMELMRRMKPYEFGRTDALIVNFGSPEKVFPLHAFDTDLLVYKYRCPDGIVSVTGGEATRLVVRVDAEGNP